VHESLETYLREISHYLAVEHGEREILAEIRSHILEKAEGESGAVTEEALERAIGEYGRPRDVAAKYLEGRDIISPTFRRHLVRYTAVLFSVHVILTVLAVHVGMSIIAIPFFFIPKMGPGIAIVYLLTALVYDFGLVALVLFLVTQRKASIRLPWPSLSLGGPGGRALRRPRVAGLAALAAIFVLFAAIFARYHTLFFYSVNFHRPSSPLDSAAAVFFSLLFLGALACEIIGYAVRFLFNSAWVTLIQNAVVLLILWVAWNSPIKPEFASIPGFDARTAGGAFLVVCIALTVIRFLKSLGGVAREMSLP
jgi:hypothetical protein